MLTVKKVNSNLKILPQLQVTLFDTTYKSEQTALHFNLLNSGKIQLALEFLSLHTSL